MAELNSNDTFTSHLTDLLSQNSELIKQTQKETPSKIKNQHTNNIKKDEKSQSLNQKKAQIEKKCTKNK
jgi:flagellar biosynthesis/type III secretory pathway chaperone